MWGPLVRSYQLRLPEDVIAARLGDRILRHLKPSNHLIPRSASSDTVMSSCSLGVILCAN